MASFVEGQSSTRGKNNGKHEFTTPCELALLWTKSRKITMYCFTKSTADEFFYIEIKEKVYKQKILIKI